MDRQDGTKPQGSGADAGAWANPCAPYFPNSTFGTAAASFGASK